MDYTAILPNHGVQPHWLSDGEGAGGVDSPPINKVNFKKKLEKKILEKKIAIIFHK